MSEDIDREEYPNSKLTNVSFEMRFYPLLEIDTLISSFQKEIRENLPDFRKGKIMIKDSKGIQEKKQYIFRSEAGEITLNITNYNLSIQHHRYSNYEDFKELIENIVEKFTGKFESLKELQFIGLRYTNDFEFDIDKVDLNTIVSYFNSGLDSNRIIEKQIEEYRIEQKYKINDGNFKLFIGFKTEIITNSRFFTIDLDSTFPDTHIKLESLSGKLDEMHRNIKTEFITIITEKLKNEVLRKRDE